MKRLYQPDERDQGPRHRPVGRLRSFGSRYLEPARPLRAVAVADVHVLAQNVIQHASRRRLLVFADSRQDAAFQAGWMQDHARRFRLRALMAEALGEGIGVGDLVATLDRQLAEDEAASRALLPEVWELEPQRAVGREHVRLRRQYLRIQVLRELTAAKKERLGLEPWGRLRVEYQGLDPDLEFVGRWAERLGIEPERMVDGIATILDLYRRDRIVWDPDQRIFSRHWRDGDPLIMNGFLPLMRGVPKGLKLARTADDDERWVSQWLSPHGATRVRRAAARMGVPADDLQDFIRELWHLCTAELGLLRSVRLTWSDGNPIPGAEDTWQIDSDRLVLRPHGGRWRCGTCQRTQVRPTPGDRCVQWNCDGTLVYEQEDPDDYDLAMLDRGFAMLRAKEHSAQVPHEERERLESLFKGQGDAVNTLVCTPTLEMGVDIGGLDSVLLRNVPPLPANYWQRVGRAGRRHRLAVNLTYARPTTHDRAYFSEPSKLLEGRVEPPRFNLRNELMVQKHVHAAVLTRLQQLSRDPSYSEEDREELRRTLDHVLPAKVGAYLFDEAGNLLDRPRDVRGLGQLASRHAGGLVPYVQEVFTTSWPEEDMHAVEPGQLEACVLGIGDRLEEVVATLKRRLDWHLAQMRRLEDRRRRMGSLAPDEDAQYRRCDRYVKRVKGLLRHRRTDIEGYDDTSTWSVLATEGFLPGYGLDSGSILGRAEVSGSRGVERELVLPRPPAVALREYVPGNLLYANGHKFVARRFQLGPHDPVLFQVDSTAQAVREAGAPDPDAVEALGAQALKAVPMCDAELPHRSRISDDEDFRFQMPVAIYAYEQEIHGPGTMYRWGERDLTHRKGVRLRLVNVGAARKVEQGELGYPLCLADGDSRSPFASDRELADFREYKQDRGSQVERVGFFADVVVDALGLQDLEDREQAWSVLEALRIGMSLVLEMDREDVQVQVVGRGGSEQVDGLLYDPMPGGSGLLEQALERWPEVLQAARSVVTACPGDCDRSCVDCLQSFRNAFYHRYLDRHLVARFLDEHGDELVESHPIQPRHPTGGAPGDEMPAGRAEDRLRRLLERARLPVGQWHERLFIGHPYPATEPDVFYELGDDLCPGVCIYVDGLSGHLHGNPETAEVDREIRTELRNRGYEVIEIAASHLDDRERMRVHFGRLARALGNQVPGGDWFDG